MKLRFFTVQRLVEEKLALSAEITESGTEENLTTNEWKLAEGNALILSLFEEASRDMSKEGYSTLSMKVPALCSLRKKLQTFVNDAANRGSSISLARKLMPSSDK